MRPGEKRQSGVAVTIFNTFVLSWRASGLKGRALEGPCLFALCRRPGSLCMLRNAIGVPSTKARSVCSMPVLRLCSSKAKQTEGDKALIATVREHQKKRLECLQ